MTTANCPAFRLSALRVYQRASGSLIILIILLGKKKAAPLRAAYKLRVKFLVIEVRM